jgi:hypothetical protein
MCVVLLARFLGKLRTYQAVEGEDMTSVAYTVAVPGSLGEAHVKEVLDAARIAGLPEPMVRPTSNATPNATPRPWPCVFECMYVCGCMCR